MIPRDYIERLDILRANVGLVGFSGHGKTVYLTSLFSALGQLSVYWQNYYYRSLDEYSHQILYEQVPLFEKGRLPDSTPANFPNPTLVYYHQIPVSRDQNNFFLNYYDTAGEVYTDADQISRAGYFVAHSDIVLFIVSLSDCDPERFDEELSRLIDTYIRAVEDRLNRRLKTNQHLVLVFSKADIIADMFPQKIKDWLELGHNNWYAHDLFEKFHAIQKYSLELHDWLLNDLKCFRFINMVNDHFKSVNYTVVSATDPSKNLPDPLRVLDPFLFILHLAKPLQPASPVREGFWQKLKGSMSGNRKK